MKFSKKVFPNRVDIYENFNGGAVTRMMFMQTNNKWYTVWSTNTVQRHQNLRTFSVTFEVSSYHNCIHISNISIYFVYFGTENMNPSNYVYNLSVLTIDMLKYIFFF